MKKSLSEVAKAFNLPPATLILYLSSLGAPIDDCWPEVDDIWLETLKSRYSKYLEVKNIFSIPIQQGQVDISQDAIKLIDKLYRKDYWGNHTIAWDHLRNHLLPQAPNCKELVEILMQKELLRGPSIHGPFSLNGDKKKEITLMVERFRQKNA